MLDKLGCFAMGFAFAIVLGIVNAEVREQISTGNCIGCTEHAPVRYSANQAMPNQHDV
jgi:hypothetical protein